MGQDNWPQLIVDKKLPLCSIARIWKTISENMNMKINEFNVTNYNNLNVRFYLTEFSVGFTVTNYKFKV